ncbi:lasso peptide biosynthesis B2 protein [Flavobacterium flavipallidum]|uniref:Lasso peptide biosynthesis B2 protein n=1 Tax=Flavobacterium flavipallidum TaxID=3139140 RepID=A0ABU9HID3_9FLAO
MKRLLRKFKNIFILSRRQWKLILLVFWLSIYRNILLFFKSRKAFSEDICKNQQQNLQLTTEKIQLAKDITLAIAIANKRIPWKNVCRHQSWQAVYILLKYQIPFEYIIGIERKHHKKEGHSWVKVNGKFICGGCNENDYAIIYNKKIQ